MLEIFDGTLECYSSPELFLFHPSGRCSLSPMSPNMAQLSQLPNIAIILRNRVLQAEEPALAVLEKECRCCEGLFMFFFAS